MARPQTLSPLQPKTLRQRVARLSLPLLAVLTVGTALFMWTEGWSTEQALYFTVITFTTVGYGDYDLSSEGHRAAVAVILLGFGTFTYVIGQIVQIIVERELDWEAAFMDRKAEALSDHFIIIGFGRIGRTVCDRLREEQIPFVVIDQERERIEDAVSCGHIGKIGDATRDEMLESCGVRRARGLASLTSDANNIVITLSARAISPDLTIISRAEHEDAARKLEHAGATRVISPMHSGAIAVANTILRPHAVEFLDHTARATEGIEFSRLTVLPGSTLDGSSIASSPIRADIPLVVVALRRADGSTQINPGSDTRLVAGDTLIIAGHPGAVVNFCTDAAA